MTKRRKTRMLLSMACVQLRPRKDVMREGGRQRGGSSVRRLPGSVNQREAAAPEGSLVVVMICLVLSVLSIASVSRGQGNYASGATISEVVRRGATIAATVLNSKLPNLHSSAFPKMNEEMIKESGEGKKNEAILTLLGLMGVDSRKIHGFAFDAFISLLRLMSQVLLKHRDDRRGRRTSRNFSALQFILEQPQVVGLLKDMQNPRLMDLILKESEERLRNSREENVDCIRLLVCKTKPFVRGMQRSLRFFTRRESITVSGGSPGECTRNPAECGLFGQSRVAGEAAEGGCLEGEEDARWEAESLEGRMFFFVPALGEVLEEGDKCDLLFPNCLY